jgi:hypothetical protein
MQTSRRHAGPLCGATNALPPDPDTLVPGRSVVPGAQLLSVAGLATEAKLEKCLYYAADAVPGHVGNELRALARPEALGAMALMLGVTAGAQLTPFGWVADVIGFCLGAYALGSSVWQVAGDLRAFGSEFQSASSEPDLKAAGSHLAHALSIIGVGTFMLWLTKKGARAALSTQELLAAARSVVLHSAEREIAFWSGVDPMRIPTRYATLEGMLSETPAGRALLNALQSRNDFKKDQAVWYELSSRMAELGSESRKPVHYFVARSRGYRAALQLGEVPRAWWQEYRPKLAGQMRTSLAREGKAPAEIEQRIARLSNWSQEDIEAQYYAEHRSIQRGSRKLYEDEVFHKLEKLRLDGAWIHELDENNVEIGAPFWQKF